MSEPDPHKHQVLYVRIPEKVKTQLSRYALSHGITMTLASRLAIEYGLVKLENSRPADLIAERGIA